MTDYPRARVTQDPETGATILDDPDALACVRAVSKHNCKVLLEDNYERVLHFAKGRMSSLAVDDYCIILLNVDDRHGGPIADILMPDQDWQSVRDQGLVPVARGIVMRNPISDVISSFDPEAATKLRDLEKGSTAVLVVDHGVAEVFTL